VEDYTVSLIAPFAMGVALAANTGSPNSAYTAATPVLISSCSVKPEVAYYTSGDDEHTIYPQTVDDQLKITFSNTTNKQISSVTFAVRDGSGKVVYVTDAGKFSPGVTIAHNLESPIGESDHLGCTISSVAFADGTTWIEPVAAIK
jgi:hypothetical protein